MRATAPSNRSRLRRKYERGRYDKQSLYEILDACLLAHVGYVLDGAPVVTPTLYWREGDHIYWHGSSASRMLRKSAGYEVCLTVSELDGLVLARSGMHHSVNYRSAMLFGTAHKVTRREDKIERMRIFVEQMFPGRWEQLREINEQEVKATTILGMPIDEAAAKVRVGGPVDDEEDYGHPVWAGVIPFVPKTPGEPIPDDRQDPGTALPDHVRNYRVARKITVTACARKVPLPSAVQPRRPGSRAASQAGRLTRTAETAIARGPRRPVRQRCRFRRCTQSEAGRPSPAIGSRDARACGTPAPGAGRKMPRVPETAVRARARRPPGAKPRKPDCGRVLRPPQAATAGTAARTPTARGSSRSIMLSCSVQPSGMSFPGASRTHRSWKR